MTYICHSNNDESSELFSSMRFSENDDFQLADMPEELDNPTFSKYIIAFYRDEDGKHWCGSGVIVEKMLITVAHVMMEKKTKEPIPCLYYKYDNSIRRLDARDIIYDGRNGLYDDYGNIHHDLIVFNVSDISSPFILNTFDFNTPLPVYARTYIEEIKSTVGTTYKIVLKKGYRKEHNRLSKSKIFEWYNCLLTNGDFSVGNSGTPIYRNNVVYGILIGETIHEDYCFRIFNFLDARYIQETISTRL